MLGAGEDDGAVDAVGRAFFQPDLAQQDRQQGLLFGLDTKIERCSTRSAVVDCGATSTLTGLLMNCGPVLRCLRHGGAEEQALALGGSRRATRFRAR
jgi:hypothetical protein